MPSLALNPPPIRPGLVVKLHLAIGNIGAAALYGVAQQTIGKMFGSKMLGQPSYTNVSTSRRGWRSPTDRAARGDVPLADVYDALQGWLRLGLRQ